MCGFIAGLIIGSVLTLLIIFIVCAVIVAKRADQEHDKMEQGNSAPEPQHKIPTPEPLCQLCAQYPNMCWECFKRHAHPEYVQRKDDGYCQTKET